MNFFQDLFHFFDHADKRPLFVTHITDKSQPIKTNWKSGGQSPCSYDFIFTNPAQGYLNLETLKNHKTTNNGHVFTPIQLSQIVKGAMLLEDVLILIDEVVENNKKFLFEDTIKTHQKSGYKAVVNPELTLKEQEERHLLLTEPSKVKHVCFNNRYIFKSDTPATTPFIVLKDANIVIRGNLDLLEEDQQKTFLELIKTNPHAFWNFHSLLQQIDSFKNSGLPMRQEFLDIKAISSQVQSKLYVFYTRTVPLIIKMIENTRRLLFDSIIKEHWQEIAESPQKARHLLKSDHANIYKLAEKYNYIDDPDYFIRLEKRRNEVAHPDPFTSGELFAYPYEILSKFWTFICNHSNPEQLAFYFKYNPIKLNTRELDLLENDFHSLRSDEMCLMYARQKNGTPTEPLKDTKKAIASIENDPIFKADSSPKDNHQMRLGVAHGQVKQVTRANIRENTIVQMQQRILFSRT